MTVGSYKKMLKQLRGKPNKLKKFLKHNAPRPRKHGAEMRRCNRCGNPRGHIAKYGIELCRRCFRDVAPLIGWRKHS